jgi:DNA-binding CsgD family transcriptional regulator
MKLGAFRLKDLPRLAPAAKAIAIYALALAGGAFLLEWLEYKHFTRAFATEIYIVLIAAAFTGLGIWAGYRLTPQTVAPPFQRNEGARKSLGLTDREIEVLERLAAGDANKEVARVLDVSPNTIKTHVASLFQKLEVERRTQAIQKARELRLIP